MASTQAHVDKSTMLALFELAPNYTAEQLKQAYRQMIIKYHPDKTQKITETPMFQMLTSFYKALSAELPTASSAARQSTPSTPPTQLTSTTRQTFAQQPSAPPPSTNNSRSSSRHFDVEMFNKLFDKYKVKDVYEEGYESWMNAEKSFKEQSKHAVQDNEPQPFLSGGDDIPCYELGVQRIRDHSAQNHASRIQFSDYRLAHTTDRIVDPDRVKERKQYKDINALEADRANIAFTMNDKELAEYTRLKQADEKRERQRLNAMQQRDEVIMRQHERIVGSNVFAGLR